jgi:hyperosmotically inducible protein
MKTNIAIACVAVGALLGSTVAIAAENSDTTHPVTYVKDSAITTDIRTKLAAEHLTSLEPIHVDTDTDGVVWLSGSANTQEAADKAALIARDAVGATRVHSDIKVILNDRAG